MPAPESTRSTAILYGGIETAAGPVSFAVDGAAVRRIRLGRWPEDDDGPERPTAAARRLAARVARELEAYFAGRRVRFELPFALRGVPPFTRRVLARVAEIPFGEALAYGEVATLVGNPRAARAVGQAVGANPLPLLIPCHRVLASNEGLGGFGCGLGWKRFLLDLEGIRYRG